MSPSIGRYNIIRKIGSGGMAEVFLARSKGAQGTEKILVVKKIHPTLAQNRRFLDMFVDEARVAMRLNHSNIVQVYAFDQVDDDHLLAMEHVDGSDLLEIRLTAEETGKRIPFGLSAFIAAEIAKGLDYAHTRKGDHGETLDIVHRDVSPQNVLISRDGAVKVADFGIAKARSVHEEFAGEVKGKFGYMAPEQAKGLSVDRRADIFALGVVLHEMLCGRSLVTVKKDENPLLAASIGEHPSPREIDSEVPVELDAIVKRAMSPQVENRYPNARAFARDLGVFLHGLDEIFDAQRLETWVRDLLPESQMPEVGLPETLIERASGLPDEATVPMRALGEMEQRAVVLVSARFNIAPHPDRTSVNAELLRLADEIAFKSEGVMREVPGGLRIFLGLQHSSLLDAINGLRIAHDLQDVIRVLGKDNQLRIEAKLAVNRGEVEYKHAVGEGSSSFAPEKALIETSNSLMDNGVDGSIMAGGGVFRLARQEYKFGDPVTITLRSGEASTAGGPGLKGYPVGRGKTRKERDKEKAESGTFMGRELELGQLRELFERARAGKVTTLSVTGELGIGKSRLVEAFLKGIENTGVKIVRAQCLFAERDIPLCAVSEVIRAALGTADGETSVRKALEQLISGAPNYLQRQVEFFEKSMSMPDVAWAHAGENRRHLIRRVAFGLGVILSTTSVPTGLVLVVENAHWADGPSVDTLAELATASGSAPIMVVLVGKPSLLTGRKIANLKSLELKEIPDSVMRRILKERLGTGGDIKAIVAQIQERAQGNPFFAGEIIDSLIERGIITPVTRSEGGSEGPRFRQARPGAVRLPTTMEGLAASQVDALDDSARTVLRAASAIGSAFNMATVTDLVGDAVQAEMSMLVDRGFLVRTEGDRGDEATYRFRKPMVREAAYGGLSRQDRHRIHRTLARDLIAQSEKGSMVPAARIAWHLDKGGESERAGDYYLRGGDAAMSVNSNRRALRLYDRALSVIPRGTKQRQQALLRREKVLKDLGLHRERSDAVNEMEHIAVLLEDVPMQVLALIRRAQLEFDKGDLASSARTLSRALVLMDGVDDPYLSVEIFRLLAYVASEEGHLDGGLECCDHALAMTPEGPDGEYLKARALGIKGFVLLAMGRLDLAPVNLASSLVLFRRYGKRRNQSVVMSNLALLARARGNLQEGIEFLEQAILIDREIRNLSARGRKMVALGSIYVELGDFANGQSLLEEGRSISLDNQESLGEVEADMGLAELWLQLKDAQGANEILREVATRGLISRSLVLQTRHQQLLFEIAMETGDIAGALAAATEATRIARAAGMVGEVVHGSVRRGFALLATGEREQALAATDRIEDLIEEIGGVRKEEEVWWLRARVLDGAGLKEQAAAAQQRARSEMDRKANLITNLNFREAYKSHPLRKRIMAGLSG